MTSTADATERLLQGQREVLARLASGAPLDDILSCIAHYSEVCTPEMQASILWYEPSSGKLRRGGHARLPDAFADTVDGLVPGPQAGSCGTAAFQRARVVSFDVQEDPLWSGFREFAASHDIRSAWSTPLLSPADGSLLGVFGMYYPDTREPSDRDLSLVDHFTHLASIAIERWRRDEALRESERRRHQGLLALTAGMAHELNTPLGVARTAMHLLQEQLGETGGSSPLTDTVTLVTENIDRGIALLRSFHSSVMEQSESEHVVVDLVADIMGTIKSLGPVLQSSGVDVRVDAPGGVTLTSRMSPVRLQQVITNLVTNACVHAYDGRGGALGIRIGRSLLSDHQAEIVIADQGKGMTEEVARRCTDAFFSTSRGRPGSGLGLFITRHIVEAELGGKLLLETVPGEGTRWTVLIPATVGV